ncbi:ImmA/IrrE family metallo-endopeptidase [Streptomyces sp. UNOB3_S3]|uniref:ImmA/IrrE family metallo-endopeptidase n=1 Tax=Streptomyces sp. UNOB3_S3 TaxID=2871682 RepID=UPI001E61EA4C|nr:ImmA/IrrE family metallo-endopeptidase [Streptomyces sp. UNOB3_S3]MCC3773794.1 ImmA/IrrE family metallo-endopeptidase [Streptomyces sp. UNOB3_S3]
MAIRRVFKSGEMRKLSRHCVQRLQDFPLPHPYKLETLINNIEGARGCIIHLAPVTAPVTDLRSACGLRLSFDQTHIIAYRPRPTPNQTTNIIFHELAHLWLDHGTDVEIAEELSEALQPLLAELVGPTAVVNARAHFGTAEEREAELSASFIRQQIRRQSAFGQDLLSVMEATLTHPLAPPHRGRRL